MNIYDFKTIVETKELKDCSSIITIGVFDGFHKGHQSLIREMVNLKKRYPQSQLVLITFSQNPKTRNPKNIDSLRLREENAQKYGIDSFVIIDFSPDFSRISSSGFIKMLTSSLSPVALVVGEDFQLGNPSSSSSANELSALFNEYGKSVEVVVKKSILTEGGEKISSTLVRRVIEKGEVEGISSLTGQDYRVDLLNAPFKEDECSLVVLKSFIQQLLPPPGVYGARLAMRDGSLYPSIVSIEEDSIKIIGKNVDLLDCLDKRGEQLDSIYFLEKENGFK